MYYPTPLSGVLPCKKLFFCHTLRSFEELCPEFNLSTCTPSRLEILSITYRFLVILNRSAAARTTKRDTGAQGAIRSNFKISRIFFWQKNVPSRYCSGPFEQPRWQRRESSLEKKLTLFRLQTFVSTSLNDVIRPNYPGLNSLRRRWSSNRKKRKQQQEQQQPQKHERYWNVLHKTWTWSLHFTLFKGPYNNSSLFCCWLGSIKMFTFLLQERANKC